MNKIEDKISEFSFYKIADYIKKISGINLSYEKEYLIRQRLSPLLNKLNFSSFDDLAAWTEQRNSFINKHDIISAITTNETSFFRDNSPFHLFSNFLIEDLINKFKSKIGKKEIRIWSAGCSRGQEVYSLAMLIYEYIEKNRPIGVSLQNFKIIGSDIHKDSVEYARKGVYSKIETSRGLDKYYLDKYFESKGNSYEINPRLKKIVEFNESSLHDNHILLETAKKYDLIFARNVMIYFEKETKQKLLNLFYKLLNKESYLLLGSSENLLDFKTKFISETHGNVTLYKKGDE